MLVAIHACVYAMQTEREKMRDEAQKRIAKVKGDLAFDKSNHPLIVACVLDSEKVRPDTQFLHSFT